MAGIVGPVLGLVGSLLGQKPKAPPVATIEPGRVSTAIDRRMSAQQSDPLGVLISARDSISAIQGISAQQQQELNEPIDRALAAQRAQQIRPIGRV